MKPTMPELRKDPISGRWVIIATDRAKRPHQHGSTATEPCPFCPGNEAMTPPEVLAYRRSGDSNAPGWSLRVVPNKYPALEQTAQYLPRKDGLLESTNSAGVHEVIIESPEHVTDIGSLSKEQIALVLRAYQQRLLHWRNDPRWQYLMIFKNQGELAGASLEHVHSQLVALPAIPNDIVDQIDRMSKHRETTGRCIYCEMIEREIERGERLVWLNKRFVVLCPYAPRFSYEICILPIDHRPVFEDILAQEMATLANTLLDTLARLSVVANDPPFNLVIYTSPKLASADGHYHWHMEIMPQLTRAAGFEWGLGAHLNSVTPETAARLLRDARI
jgi:UDPglucose--hexose-1-phosphate uridylyltransferase